VVSFGSTHSSNVLQPRSLRRGAVLEDLRHEFVDAFRLTVPASPRCAPPEYTLILAQIGHQRRTGLPLDQRSFGNPLFARLELREPLNLTGDQRRDGNTVTIQ
jgi:hypothetical protein